MGRGEIESTPETDIPRPSEVLFLDRLAVFPRCLFPTRHWQERPLIFEPSCITRTALLFAGALDWRLVVRHTAAVLCCYVVTKCPRWLITDDESPSRSQLSAAIGCARVCVNRVSASVKSRGECTYDAIWGKNDRTPDILTATILPRFRIWYYDRSYWEIIHLSY